MESEHSWRRRVAGSRQRVSENEWLKIFSETEPFDSDENDEDDEEEDVVELFVAAEVFLAGSMNGNPAAVGGHVGHHTSLPWAHGRFSPAYNQQLLHHFLLRLGFVPTPNKIPVPMPMPILPMIHHTDGTKIEAETDSNARSSDIMDPNKGMATATIRLLMSKECNSKQGPSQRITICLDILHMLVHKEGILYQLLNPKSAMLTPFAATPSRIFNASPRLSSRHLNKPPVGDGQVHCAKRALSALVTTMLLDDNNVAAKGTVQKRKVIAPQFDARASWWTQGPDAIMQLVSLDICGHLHVNHSAISALVACPQPFCSYELQDCIQKSRMHLHYTITFQELEHFYKAYCKYGKDWKKVALAVRNRSVEMVEALYTMNRVKAVQASTS
ncbi:hypothetical protein JHK82_031602 [Glycine max]|nr:hypothetical protein JHK82_031602 [Glycine max]